MKKGFALILSLILLLFSFPVAASGYTDGIYAYDVNIDKAMISKCDFSATGNIVIPSTLGGYPVTAISDEAFKDCENITGVEIPSGVTSIGKSAFEGCNNLEFIHIPESVTAIGENAFSNCRRLTSISVAASNSYYADMGNCLIEIATKKLVLGTDTSVIPSDGSVTVIADNAFKSRKVISSVVIPDSVTAIGSMAFAGCTGLASISFGNQITSIGTFAFGNTKWYDNQPDGLIYIGNVAYSYKGSCPEDVLLEDDCISIAGGAFSGCSELVNVQIPESVTAIGEDAFMHCSRLAIVYIPNSVASIGAGAFYGCSSLTNIRLPESVTSIYDQTFAWCVSLTEIIIPETVSKIESYAFYHCEKLLKITIPDSVTFIDNDAFAFCELQSIRCDENSCAQSYATENGIPTDTTLSSCNHSFLPRGVRVQATCIRNGVDCLYCTTCGKEEDKIVKPYGHSYSWEGFSSNAVMTCRYCKDTISSELLPTRATVQLIGATKILFTAEEGYEYSLNQADWQSGGLFTGLDAKTTYNVYRRFSDRTSKYAQYVSLSTVVKTESYDSIDQLPQAQALVFVRQALLGNKLSMASDVNGDNYSNIKDLVCLKKQLACSQ